MRPAEESAGGPVGSGNHVVRAGECIDSIAFEHGFFGETLWDHPDNSELKRKRENPNVLLAGDRVAIPQLRKKSESGAMDQRHRFRRKGVPLELAVQFVVNGQPRANTPYRLIIDGVASDGELDGDGWLRVSISPAARRADLTLRPQDEPEEEYELELGRLDPSAGASGALHRLKNLGYYVGSDELDDAARSSIGGFQRAHGLQETGEMDEATMSQLKALHGS